MAAAFLTAQSPGLSVEVSSDTLLLGNYFELKYTIENADMSALEVPDLSAFKVLSGPNTSSSISIMNGRMTQKASLAFYLEPPDIGSYTIPPAYLTVDETTVETPPIEIIAIPNPEGIIRQPGQAGKKFDPLIIQPVQPDTVKVRKGKKI